MTTTNNKNIEIMSLVNNKMSLATWLNDQLNERSWSQADLARAAGLSRAAISRLLSEGARPMPDTLTAIADALKLPPEDVFRVGGLLPQKIEDPPGLGEWVWTYLRATPEERRQMLEVARALSRGHSQSSEEG